MLRKRRTWREPRTPIPEAPCRCHGSGEHNPTAKHLRNHPVHLPTKVANLRIHGDSLLPALLLEVEKAFFSNTADPNAIPPPISFTVPPPLGRYDLGQINNVKEATEPHNSSNDENTLKQRRCGLFCSLYASEQPSCSHYLEQMNLRAVSLHS